MKKNKIHKDAAEFLFACFYKIRQGASMVSCWLYVAIDATLNMDKKTGKNVDLIFSEAITVVEFNAAVEPHWRTYIIPVFN